jgi:hypothetical protein
MARKPPALARELLRNFPKRRARNARRRRKGPRSTGAETNGAAPREQLNTDAQTSSNGDRAASNNRARRRTEADAGSDGQAAETV